MQVETHRYFSCSPSPQELMPGVAAHDRAGRAANTMEAPRLVSYKVAGFDDAQVLQEFCAPAEAEVSKAVVQHDYAHRMATAMSEIGTAAQGKLKLALGSVQTSMKTAFEKSKHILSSIWTAIWAPWLEGKHDIAIIPMAQSLKSDAVVPDQKKAIYDGMLYSLSKALEKSASLEEFQGAGVTYDRLDAYLQLRGSSGGDPIRSLVTNLGLMCKNTRPGASCFGADEGIRRQIGKLRESSSKIDAICARLTPWGDDRKWTEMQNALSAAEIQAGAAFDKEDHFLQHFGRELSADIAYARNFLKHLHSVFHDEHF